MSNREKNNEYDNLQVVLPKKFNYDFTELDLAIRRMVTMAGFERDQSNYQKMKEMYQ
jgi:uncharacterized membrane protein